MNLAGTIVFGRGGNSRTHLVEGFAEEEDGFTWAVGTRCRMELRAPPMLGNEQSDHLLEIACNPFTSSGLLRQQRLITLVNGVELCDEMLRGEGTLGYLIPRHALAPDSRLHIELRYPQSATPAELGLGADARRLGFMIRNISIQRVPPAPKTDIVVLPPLHLPQGADAVDAALCTAIGRNRRQLALCFESLGHNCEFGLVQRHLGAEPLSLLRFAGITLDDLLIGLTTAFAAIGEQLLVRTWQTASGKHEYLVYDERYRVGLHTFRTPEETTPQQVRDEHAKRLIFVQRQFGRWLRTGERIFVFQRPGQITPSQALPLLARLRRHGPNALLYVDQTPGPPSGTVEQLGYGFFHGVLDRMAPSEDAGDTDLPGWLSLCANAARLWAAQRAGAGGCP